MKLASLKQGGRDGTLVVVSKDLQRAVPVPAIAPTLQLALEKLSLLQDNYLWLMAQWQILAKLEMRLRKSALKNLLKYVHLTV